MHVYMHVHATRTYTYATFTSTYTYLQVADKLQQMAGLAASASLTPRTTVWLSALPIPADEKSKIAFALADNAYISMETFKNETADSLTALFCANLKPGSKLALRKALADLKVR
jgi:hypothetical protein